VPDFISCKFQYQKPLCRKDCGSISLWHIPISVPNLYFAQSGGGEVMGRLFSSTKSVLRGQNCIDNGGGGGFIVHTSFVKCFEQDTTFPDHRFQRAVGGAKRQQGTGRPSPVSSRGERQRMPSNRSRSPTVNRVCSPIHSGSGRAAGFPASKVVTRKLRSAAGIAAILAFVFAMGFRYGKPTAEAGLFFLLRHWRRTLHF